MDKEKHITRLIKSKMAMQGITLSGLAKQIGVSRYWVSAIVNGRANSKHVKRAIAEAIGAKVTDLWPEVKTQK